MSQFDYRGSRVGHQVFVEHGTVHMAPADVPDLPTCPEPYIPHVYSLSSGNFVGRESELNLLSEWAQQGTEPVLAIIGLGGAGKSALAWRWFQNEIERSPRAFDGFLWWSFYEDDAGYINFILHALAYLSGEKLARVADRSVEENCRRLISLLGARRVLLCLDGHERITDGYRFLEIDQAASDVALFGFVGSGAIDAAYAGHSPTAAHSSRYRQGVGKSGAFFRQICGIRNSRVLITSRLRPAEFETPQGQLNAGVRQHDEMQLSDRDAIALLGNLQITAHEDTLLRIVNAVGNHALTLRVLAGDVRRDRRACGALDVWLKARPDFDLAALNIIQRKTHVLHVALLGLSAKTLTTLASIAAFRGPADYDHLAHILVQHGAVHANEIELDQALDELEQRHLLGWSPAFRSFDMHPIIRGIVWRRLGEVGRRQIALFHGEYFGDLVAEDGLRSAQQFYLMHQWFFSLIELKRYEDAFDLLKRRVVEDVLQQGRGHEVVEMLEALLGDRNTGLIRLETPTKRADCLNSLSFAYSHVCRHFDSVHCAAQLAEYLGSLSEEDAREYKVWIPRNAAVGLIHLGRTKDARAFWEVAKRYSSRRRDIETEELLGRIALAEGQIEKAIAHLAAFIIGWRDYDDKFPTDLASAALAMAIAMDDNPASEINGLGAYKLANLAVFLANKHGLAALLAQAEIVKVDLEARQREDRSAALPRLRRLVENARRQRFSMAEIEGLSRILGIATDGGQVSISEQAAEELEHLSQLHDRRALQARTWPRLMHFHLARNDRAAVLRAAQATLKAAIHPDNTLAMPLVVDEIYRCEPELATLDGGRSDPEARARAVALDNDVRTLIAAFQP